MTNWMSAPEGSWDYEKGRELYYELANDDTYEVVLPAEETTPAPYSCGCLVCRFDGPTVCQKMTYTEHQARLERFEDYSS